MSVFVLLGGCVWIPESEHEALLASLVEPADDTGDACSEVAWYRDADGDGAGNPDEVRSACEAPTGYLALATDCDDTDPNVQELATWYPDVDGDGYGDDAAATESCGAPAGFIAEGGDCDDDHADANPDGVEICDGIDQDCDGDADDGVSITVYADSDGDGFGDPTAPTEACELGAGFSADDDDCDDTASDVHPGADEVCNDVDDNCDGYTDTNAVLVGATTFYPDTDTDGFGDPERGAPFCDAPPGMVEDGTDCDDTLGDINPGATESCDEIDNDCDLLIDDSDDSVDLSTGATFYADGDGDGYGDVATLACAAPADHVATGGDCNDSRSTINPGRTEVCNDTDDDCDGKLDDDDGSLDPSTGSPWYLDDDGDGFGAGSANYACDAPADHVADDEDCDDTDAEVKPEADEKCDEIDNDCDAFVDDDDDDVVGAPTWYADGDTDGAGDDDTETVSCDAPAGYVDVGGDCNDGDAYVTPETNPAQGIVTLVKSSGATLDYSTTFAAGTAASPVTFAFTENGSTLRLCAGTWYARVDMVNYTSVTVEGYGGAGQVILDAAASGSVVTVANGGGTVTGVTLTGGDASSGGGASVTNGGSLTLSDCVVTGNTADYYGGGIQLTVGSPTLTMDNCVVSNNASTNGGGLNATAGGVVMTITDSEFSGNTAQYGGAIMNSYGGGTLTVSGSRFEGNSASNMGGAISVYGGDVTVQDTVISGNDADVGGGIYTVEGDVYLDGVTLTGNVAASNGGAIAGAQGVRQTFEITDSTLSGNSANAGGAIALFTGSATITDTAVHGNTAVLGGGVTLDYTSAGGASFACHGSASVAAGIWGNTATSNGGGVWIHGTSTLSSDSCDWTGTGTNGPQDIYTLDASGASFTENYGDDASFSCTTTGGCL